MFEQLGEVLTGPVLDGLSLKKFCHQHEFKITSEGNGPHVSSSSDSHVFICEADGPAAVTSLTSAGLSEVQCGGQNPGAGPAVSDSTDTWTEINTVSLHHRTLPVLQTHHHSQTHCDDVTSAERRPDGKQHEAVKKSFTTKRTKEEDERINEVMSSPEPQNLRTPEPQNLRTPEPQNFLSWCQYIHKYVHDHI